MTGLDASAELMPIPQAFELDKGMVRCGLVHVPASCAQEVIVEENSELPVTENYLLSNIAVTVPINKSQVTTAMPLEWGRSTLIDNELDEGGIFFRKGSWISGETLILVLKSSKLNTSDYLGLYHENDAKLDMRVSSSAIRHGFWAAKTLGYVILDPTALQTFLKGYWSDYPVMMEMIDNSFRNLRGRNPAQLFRQGGVMRRIDVNPLIGQANIEYARSDIIDGAKQLYRHASAELYETTAPFLDSIKFLTEQRTLDVKNVNNILMLLTHIYARNSAAILTMNADPSSPKLRAGSFDKKDIDLSHKTYDFDFEETLSQSPVSTTPYIYAQNAAGWITAYCFKYLRLYFRSDIQRADITPEWKLASAIKGHIPLYQK